jgi:hypothetical protein
MKRKKAASYDAEELQTIDDHCHSFPIERSDEKIFENIGDSGRKLTVVSIAIFLEGLSSAKNLFMDLRPAISLPFYEHKIRQQLPHRQRKEKGRQTAGMKKI